MSIEVYSRCRIRYVPNDRQQPERNYPENSQIELRNYNSKSYSLRAIDIQNKQEEIFNFPLENENRYKFGRSSDQPDELQSTGGTYNLWLNDISRDHFHEVLTKTYEDLSERKPSSGRSSDNSHNTNQPQVISSTDLLLDIHQLGKCIENGDTNKAVQLATQLALAGAQLEAKPTNNQSNEQEILIHIQLDGNQCSLGQDGPKIPLHVFPSTTIRELRAALELTRGLLPTTQYFFVNGRLAHDDESMLDLNVGPNTLFILFELTYRKTFRENGPWTCSSCRTKNESNHCICSTCFADRIA